MKQTIVIVGSGWVSKGFLKHIDYDKFNVILISPSEYFTIQPNFAQFLNDHSVDIQENLQTSYPKIKYQNDFIDSVQLDKNKIASVKKSYEYDYVIFCHGSIINDFNIEGIKENCHILKSYDDANVLKSVIQKLDENAHVAILGCGLCGSEVVGHLVDMNKFKITAIDGLPKPLNVFNKNLQNYTVNLWNKYGVTSYFNHFVKKVDKEKITFANNNDLKYDLAIWCGGIKKSPLTDIINKHIGVDNRFGIPVNDKLQIQKYSNAFAAGDCAYSGFPPTAQNAYQQGIYLAKQFNNDFNMEKYELKNKGQVCYVGKNNAVYQHNDIYLSGTAGYFMMKAVKFYMKFI